MPAAWWCWCSPAVAIGSPHVLREVERASSKKRPVLSIRLDAAPLLPELEYFLSANQWLEAAGSTLDSVLPALIDSVRARDPNSTSRAMPPTASPAAPSASGTMVGARSKRPALMIGAAVAALAAAVAAGLVAGGTYRPIRARYGFCRQPRTIPCNHQRGRSCDIGG